jgi:hypothetical protein
MRDPRRSADGRRYPGYDVLSKRQGPYWNEQTRRVISRRLAIGDEPRFFSSSEFHTVIAIAARIVPQPNTRPPIPVAALVDEKLARGASDGFRLAGMPRDGDAWRLGLKAFDVEVREAYAAPFRDLAEGLQDAMLERMQRGELKSPAWGSITSSDFFKKRMAHDIVLAYYAHSTAWSEIGWGGPASPRGYVRLDFNERDPWEAVEDSSGDAASVQWANRHVK